MTILKVSIALFSMVFLLNCNTTKNTGNAMTSDTSNSTTSNSGNDMSGENNEASMMESGYSKGVIVYSDKEGDCPYTIQVVGSDAMFDPVNLSENFKKAGEKIWFTYSPLRMMNRCDKANPVNVDDIKTR
ncbi:MAG: hypothetical protein OQJ83_05065 [Altibacter sp.]|uniref:hypothetical protein n=1 Tax=Altibacter lentus TaxID=1223410 RepID=UPI000555F47E|nr:hypothetical protein [Altibacter lentus]MCW8980737.1 hypothetical protein [Altibacter sp.]